MIKRKEIPKMKKDPAAAKTGAHPGTAVRLRTRQLTFCALLAALLCVVSPFSIALPVSEVPLSLTTFFLYLGAAILPCAASLSSVAVYLLLGAVGLPVFSGAMGGIGRLVGPTGGFLLGYLPMVATIGLLVMLLRPEKGRFRAAVVYPVAMIAGTAVLYAFGCVMYRFSTGVSLSAAVAACTLPFLPGDAVKIALAAVLVKRLHPLLAQWIR